MREKYREIIKSKCTSDSYSKLEKLDNSKLMNFIGKYVELCNPESIFVRTDSEEDRKYIRKQAVELSEERKLNIEGHTAHFDGYNDQARDKENTKYLLTPEVDLGENINRRDRKEGLEEIRNYLNNIMEGKKLFICFFSLGPKGGEFTLPAVQLTDSAYVAHSEDILFRPGYEEFKNLKEKNNYLRFLHSAGELINGVSKNIDKRRVYIDLQEEIVYSTNTQYGGNTLGLKKLAMRLAIKRASKSNWLTEHMFIMGIHGENDRTTYFTGAYPSACGKTSTAMLPEETIVGDDIAYLRKIDKEVRAANVERGMFGIIRDVNSESDPLIWKALNEPGEVIFSNILITEDGEPYWIGKDEEVPEEGINFSGKWFKGKKDEEGNEIPPSHKNARYTLRISKLDNQDPNINKSDGVTVQGIIYGGRDSDTWMPVEEAFSWEHGIVTKGAALESETTSATLGKQGVRKFNPMSNLDFLSIPIGEYIKNNLDFKEGLDNVPRIFSVNYFLKDKDGHYLNDIHDKHVWLKWMERRVHKEVGAIKTPTGYIPKYEDLQKLFKEVLGKEYRREDYNMQFTVRVPEKLSKIDRITEIYKSKVKNAPKLLFDLLKEQRERLEKTKEKFGEYIEPSNFNK